jgi:hypothetical protein
MLESKYRIVAVKGPELISTPGYLPVIVVGVPEKGAL